MEDQVTHFINPCGHTFCSGCLENHLGIEDITNDNTIYNGKKCPICRTLVTNDKEQNIEKLTNLINTNPNRHNIDDIKRTLYEIKNN